MSVPIRSRTSTDDPVARSHRRAARFRALSLLAFVVILTGGVVWLLFASSVFAVTELVVTGASPSVERSLRESLEGVLGRRTLGFFRPARNIVLLDTLSVANLIRSTFPSVREVAVTKHYPHALNIAVTERIPLGAWCKGDDCVYFDDTGARWGTAIPSRGPLLLLVRDERASAEWNERLFAGLMTAVDGLPALGLRAIVLTLPNAAPGDVRIRTGASYELYLDVLGDVGDQMSTLAVYLAEKAADTAWKPAYIDLRTPGRVYVK